MTVAQMHLDALRAIEEEVSLTLNGSKRSVPGSLLLYKQLMFKGLNGDTRCLIKAIEMRHEIIRESDAERFAVVKAVILAEKDFAADPENVTDVQFLTLKAARDYAFKYDLS